MVHIRARAGALSFFLLGLGSPLFALGGDLGPGSAGAEFLTIGVGARPVGLSGAYTGVSDDVYSMLYNPAGLGFLRRQELGFAHDSYASGVNQEWAGYAYPTALGTWGVAINALFVAPFAAYDADDQPIGQSSAMDSSAQISYALAMSDTLSLGVSGKRIASRLWNSNAQTAALDGGALWEPIPRLRLGGAFMNLGPPLRYESADTPLPITMRAGASWTPYDRQDFRHWFTLSFDVIMPRSQAPAVAGGLELWYEDILALRGGGRSDAGTGVGFTMGAGIYLFRGIHKPFELGFDYAFEDAGEFSQMHRVSVVMRFGDPVRVEDRIQPFGSRASRERAAERRRARTMKSIEATPSSEIREVTPTGEPSVPAEYQKWIKP